MYQDPSSKPSKIEQTRRALYDALAKVRKAKKHPKATDALETALEEHLQALKEIADQAQQDAITARQELYCAQRRMQSVDHAYTRSQAEMTAIGDEIRRRDRLITKQRAVIGELFMQVRGMKP